jgi:hypothetical protein
LQLQAQVRRRKNLINQARHRLCLTKESRNQLKLIHRVSSPSNLT